MSKKGYLFAGSLFMLWAVLTGLGYADFDTKNEVSDKIMITSLWFFASVDYFLGYIRVKKAEG